MTRPIRIGFLLAALVGCHTGPAAGPDVDALPAGPEVKLVLTCDSLSVEDLREATLSLVNRGTTPATVVLPGDGSPSGLRTPRIEWVVQDAKGRRIVQHERAGCPHINPLRVEELVVLQPGDAVALGRYIGRPEVWGAAPYRVSVRYVYEPVGEWPWWTVSDELLRDLAVTEPLTLESNVLVVGG